MKDVYQLMSKLLNEKENFVLATILEKSGPAPREEGTKMLIKGDFSIGGTIGGGLLEAMTVKQSAKVFQTGKCITENFDLSNHNEISLGTHRGGDLKVLLEYVDCEDAQMLALYKKLLELKKGNEDFVLITRMPEKKSKITGKDKWICTETGIFGTEDDDAQSVLRKIREDFTEVKMHEMIQGKDEYLYLIEPYFHYENACIIGGGHVAQKIAEITKMLGFYTVVVDDREEFANRVRFQTADEIKAIPSFGKLPDYIKINHNSYVMIVTRGHAYDKEVLTQMLKTDAKYIGMIGSRNKKESIYSSLLKEGFTLEDLGRVYCPIGLSINAQTPEEIAVSIAAELVKVKRGMDV